MSAEKTQIQSKSETKSAKRVITIIATRGPKVKLEFESDSWSELKALLGKGGKDAEGNTFPAFSLNNTKSVESIKRNTLENANALLPDGNFNLFIMPLKNKSGSERSDCYDTIKALIAKDPSLKATIGNYTQMKTSEMVGIINKLGKKIKSSSSTSAKPAKEVKEKKEKVSKEKISKEKSEKIGTVVKSVGDGGAKLDKILVGVNQIIAILSGKSDTLPEKATATAIQQSVKEDKVPEKKVEAEESEEEDFEAEMRAIAGGDSEIRL